MANNPTITLADLSQGMTRTNPLLSTLTIGELQKLLQRPKELRLIYDFNNLSRANTNEPSPTAFLHYVIQMANQCLTSIAERQLQTETKTARKTNTKKQQNARSKCYCSCCPYHQQCQLNIKDQRRPITKASNSPNTEICALLQMPQSIPPQDYTNEDMLTVQTTSNNNLNEGNRQIDDKHDPFDALSWSAETVSMTTEQAQVPANTTPMTNTSNTELPPLLTLLLPMMNGVESHPPAPLPAQSKPPAIIFSSNNGVIDDPLIQSLAAEQAASAHNYDLLSHRHKRVSFSMVSFLFNILFFIKVRRPLRYGDQSTRPSNIQFLLGKSLESSVFLSQIFRSADANINAQQTAAANQRLLYNSNNPPDLPTTSDHPFRSDCENPSTCFNEQSHPISLSLLDDLLNDNTNMSTVSLSSRIIEISHKFFITFLSLFF